MIIWQGQPHFLPEHFCRITALVMSVSLGRRPKQKIYYFYLQSICTKRIGSRNLLTSIYLVESPSIFHSNLAGWLEGSLFLALPISVNGWWLLVSSITIIYYLKYYCSMITFVRTWLWMHTSPPKLLHPIKLILWQSIPVACFVQIIIIGSIRLTVILVLSHHHQQQDDQSKSMTYTPPVWAVGLWAGLLLVSI